MDKKTLETKIIETVSKKLRIVAVDDGTNDVNVGIFIGKEPVAFVCVPEEHPNRVEILDMQGNSKRTNLKKFLKD